MKLKGYWIPILFLSATLIAVITLLWLRGKVIDQEQLFLESSVRPFELSELLLRPEQLSVRFDEVEALAKSLEDRELVADLIVVKNSAEGENFVIYPFYESLLRPQWKDDVQNWERRPIITDGIETGALYININPAQKNIINRGLAVFSTLLIFSLGLILLSYLSQEKQLVETTSQLLEKKKEVIRLERLSLVGQLSANIFHDLKKPVLNIKHDISDRLDSPESSEPVNEKEILQQTEMFLEMLRDLGIEEFAKPKDEEAEYCDLKDIIERSKSLVRYEKGDVEIIEKWNESPPLILFQRIHLIQVFSNLFLNAYQSMEQKGTLKIEFNISSESCSVSVEDSGKGISEEIAENLFEAFRTTKEGTEGSGLGLFITKQILENAGATIHLESLQPARFVITFPKLLWEE